MRMRKGGGYEQGGSITTAYQGLLQWPLACERYNSTCHGCHHHHVIMESRDTRGPKLRRHRQR